MPEINGRVEPLRIVVALQHLDRAVGRNRILPLRQNLQAVVNDVSNAIVNISGECPRAGKDGKSR